MSDTTQNENKGDWKNREVGALWLRTSAAGTKYLSGHVSLGAEDDLEENKERVVVFSNKDKKNDKAPDYRMYRSAPPQQAATAKTEENSSNDTEDDLDVL
jgi:uncharacterized protein (DUF736 family)